MANVWDQMPGESNTHYTQFLYYRDLGPRRSLRKFYLKYAKEFLDKDEVTGKTPGCYRENIVRWHWAERAQAWDIWNLRHYGRSVAIAFVTSLELMARKVKRAIRNNEVGDVPWPQIV